MLLLILLMVTIRMLLLMMEAAVAVAVAQEKKVVGLNVLDIVDHSIVIHSGLDNSRLTCATIESVAELDEEAITDEVMMIYDN
jgi:hypothetical protein